MLRPFMLCTGGVAAVACALALVAVVPTVRADEPPPDETPPDVSITTPADGATFPAGTASITVEVSAVDPQSGVTRVGLKVDGKTVGTDTRTPWVFESIKLEPGAHTLVATADNYDGEVGTSKSVKVTLAASPQGGKSKEAGVTPPSDPTPPTAEDGCFASMRPRSAVPGIALFFAVAAGFMLRRRP